MQKANLRLIKTNPDLTRVNKIGKISGSGKISEVNKIDRT